MELLVDEDVDTGLRGETFVRILKKLTPERFPWVDEYDNINDVSTMEILFDD